MKIALSCGSPLVQSSLEFFLKNMLVSEEECDFVITDDEKKQSNKPLCLVIDEAYSHIKKPFNAQSLSEDLRAFYEKIQYSSKKAESLNQAPQFEPFSPPMQPPVYAHKGDDLESRIYALCEEHTKELAQKIIALLKTQ